MSISHINWNDIFSKEELNFYDKKIEEAEKMNSQNDLDLNYFMNVEKNGLKYIEENISNEKKKKTT